MGAFVVDSDDDSDSRSRLIFWPLTSRGDDIPNQGKRYIKRKASIRGDLGSKRFIPLFLLRN